jgi:hypothetical protein
MKQNLKDMLNFMWEGGYIIRGINAITNYQVPSL